MSDKPELIKVDLGPYASQIYKFMLFDDGEHYMADSNKILKFLHFNTQYNQKKFSKQQLHAYQNRTVAALALSPHAIKQTARDFLALAPETELHIAMSVGVAFVSKNDNYSREIGRNESVKAMTEINLRVNSVNISPSHIYINLAAHQGVSLTLRLNKKTGFSAVTGHLTGRPEDRP